MIELYTAMQKFRIECPVILKDTKGYGYKYSDLPTIFKVINPLLEKHGLGFYQSVKGTRLSTTVFHVETGQKITASADIPQDVKLKGMNDFQVLGSAITYMRRYQLSAMLGIVTDTDTDAAGEQVKPKLKKGSDAYLQAVEYLDSGKVTLDKIEKKYDISEVRKDLESV